MIKQRWNHIIIGNPMPTPSAIEERLELGIWNKELKTIKSLGVFEPTTDTSGKLIFSAPRETWDQAHYARIYHKVEELS